MALDTRNKRASAVGVTLAALVMLPAPDASIVVADRQQVSACYAGISSFIGYDFMTLTGVTLTAATLASVTLTAASLGTVTLTAATLADVTLEPD